MKRSGGIIAAVIAACLWALPLQPALADHEQDGLYSISSFANWDHGNLSVLIVPPAHGQIFNLETLLLNGNDPNELTPSNSYLRAIEAAIKAWDDAINLMGADWLKDYYAPTVYVLGRDEVPQEVLLEPDILVFADENEGFSLGTSIWAKTGFVHTPCFVRMSMSELMSFTYADMYNVTAQEYGHCLGVKHVGLQGGVDPTSDQKHPEHDVMNGFYADAVGLPGTHLHCVSNLNIAAVEHAFSYTLDYTALLNLGVEGIINMPATAYGDTCAPPPPDWRLRTSPIYLPGAPQTRSSIGKPIEGARVEQGTLKSIVGSAEYDRSDTEAQFVLQTSLARLAEDGSCEWWDPGSKTFVARDCFSPYWDVPLEAEGQWRWDLPMKLGPGTYRVASRVSSEYGNEAPSSDNTVEFHVVGRPRKR